jgi:putative aldouronate transport system substrate-binding protein
LLESDYLTSTNDQWRARATGNQAGLQFVWPASGLGGANSGLQKLNPDYKFMPMAPVKGPKGHQYKDSATAGTIIGYRLSISHTNKYPIETMKYLDYMFSEEGTELVSYGVEGVHYKKVNGKPAYTDLITKNPQGFDPEIARIRDGVDWTMLPYQIGWESHFLAMKDAAPWTVKAWELYREPGMVEAPFPTLKYNLDELSKRNQILTEIDTYKDPMIDKFIMGVEPLDKFDQFVSSINKSGLNEILKISNEAYKRYKEFGKK